MYKHFASSKTKKYERKVREGNATTVHFVVIM